MIVRNKDKGNGYARTVYYFDDDNSLIAEQKTHIIHCDGDDTPVYDV